MNSKPIALVVNDDPSQLHLASSVLTRDGFDVISCTGAEQALEVLTERAGIDVIITDLYMPGIDGWRFCRLLRSDAYRAFNSIPIVVISATFSGADAEEITTQLGADAFLPAPYEASVLRQLTRDLLGNAKPKPMPRVLVVEPEQAEANVLIDAFKANGYAVSHAANGAQALACLRASRPQIVVLSHELPDMSGEHLLEAIKEPAATTVAIVMTVDSSAARALQLIRKGADNYVPKPVLPEYVLHLCETASRRRALLRVEELLELRTANLRVSEERYRSLFENASVGIVTYALDGTVIAVNQAFETLCGRSRGDVVGKFYRLFLTPAAYADAAAKQDQAKVEKLLSWSHVVELSRPDGSTVPVEAQYCFLRGRNDHRAVILAVYRDMTAVNKLQQQRAEFSAMLAHDIRNPVGLILGCITLLLDEPPESDAELIKKWHLRIMGEARFLESLVNNYLDVSTIEAGQLKLNKRIFNLSELLKRLGQRFEGEAAGRSMSLEVSAANDVVIEGDELALERVFANLLQNAFKFTPDGGHIALRLECRRADAIVSVHDDGPGIEPNKFSLLFEKFQHLESSERREGLGLGLHIVRELVAAHGGRVEVESVVGQGSCFSVYLPLTGREPQLQPQREMKPNS